MVVNLDNLDGLPEEFLIQLRKYDKMFAQTSSFEKLENDENIHKLIVDINDWCLKNQIIGYHYTNAIQNEILKTGLTPRSGDEIKAAFIKKYFNLFTKNEQMQIEEHWKNGFDEEDVEARDGRIYFNFTKKGLKEGLADDLLTYYGGEQVYSALRGLPGMKKLTKIGIPLILKCTLVPNDISTFHEFPWGRIAVSSYHKQINPDAFREDEDGYQAVPVPPENIEILKYNP